MIGQHRAMLFLASLSALTLAAWNPVQAQPVELEDAIARSATEMVSGAGLAPGGKNIAVVQYGPALGEPLKLGEHLVRKVRIHMFERDRERALRFISQGLVLDILVKEGLKLQNAMFDVNQSRKLGQLLTADLLVHGTYEVLGGGSVELVSFLVEVQSGVTLAQSVQQAAGVPRHLMLPLSAPAETARYARIGGAQFSSHPEAAKQYRMAEVFAERGRGERARELLDGVVSSYPTSLEAVYAQIKMMNEDLTQLRQDKEYNEDLYQVVASLPPRYRQLSLYTELKGNTVNWLVELARYEYAGGGQEELALSYYDKAKALGLDKSQVLELEEAARAARVRVALRQGHRDQAELLLVEWEVENEGSPLRKQLQKEFERPKGMVTISAGDVDGVSVDPFNIDAYETTNAEFMEFVQANPEYRKSRMTRDRNDLDYLKRWNGDLTFPDDLRNVPVVFISAIVADAYCQWRKKRLPSSLEWSLAAGEGRRKFPWGEKVPTKETANFDKGLLGDPTPGDSHPQGATPEGVYHMGGNVWESTTTRRGTKAVARGGSYYDSANILANRNRELTTDEPTYSSRFLGVRCIQ